jgi:WD40 repeat protein
MATIPEGLDPKAANVTGQWVHDRPLIACRFDPVGTYVFCGSEDAVVTRFRLSDGAKTVLSGGHTTWVASFAFSNDGKVIVSGGCDGKLTWWPAPVLFKRRKPAVLRENSGLGYISNKSDQVPEEVF